MRSRPRRSSASPGCAGGSSAGSRETAARFPGASRAGRRTRSLWRKSCCRERPRPGLRGLTDCSSIATPRGPPLSTRNWRTSRTHSGHSGSGGRRRWHSSIWHSPLRRVAASYPARARSWSACRGSAPTRRARCWPSCTGEPSRSSMSIWPASWVASSDHATAPRRTAHGRCARSLFVW